MEFVHRPYEVGETIAAIATPPGEGGIAIIRISGKRALSLAEKVFSGPVGRYQSHTAHFGKICTEKGEVIDEGLLLLMRGPHSYTGEDTVELHCHGGSLITKRVLEAVLQAGARAAEPGEFTFRAFLNGKIDLVQAEAVQTLISARSELALTAAERQLEGALSQKIASFQKELTEIAAILEAWVDFPEEGLEFATREELLLQLEGIVQKMQKLHDSFHQGKKIAEGISLCLIGSPNVGKSSLMNALLRKERAIVTPIAGTTRDVLEEEIRLGGLHLRLFDTAGIRETEELVEQEGIRRTKKALEEADLILLVLDATRGIEDPSLLPSLPVEKTLLIWNKIDLPHPPLPNVGPVLPISAKEGRGIEELIAAIEKKIWGGGVPAKGEIFLTNMRHKQALAQAIGFCQEVMQGLKEERSPEFLAADIRPALRELGTIIGTNVTEDVLSAIFAKFCIGK